MRLVFNEVNIQHTTYENYFGKKGLQKAVSEAKQFEKVHGKLPTRRDLVIINRVILNQTWKDYNINSWNDFVKYVFVDVNKKTNGYYCQSRKYMSTCVNVINKWKNVC